MTHYEFEAIKSELDYLLSGSGIRPVQRTMRPKFWRMLKHVFRDLWRDHCDPDKPTLLKRLLDKLTSF